MWCKWRHKFSSGPSKTWSWLYLGEDPPLSSEESLPAKEAWERFIEKEQLPIWRDSYRWMEHYRGAEFEIVETAPREVIEKKLAHCEDLVRTNTKLASEFRAMLGF